VYLQVVSFTVIKAFCPYCFTQALTMLLSFGVTLALLGTVRRLSGDDPELQMGKGWLPGIAILSALTGVFMFVSISNAKAAVGGVSYLSPSVANSVELVPKDAYIYGDLNAPITVVEFADICCPSCQLTSPKMHEYVNQNNGRVRWVYRHFPLPSHTMAIPAAVAAEYAGQEGRYYEFLEIVMRGLNGQIPDNPGPIQGAIRAANLDVEKFESLIGDSKNPVYERIARDRNAAVELGIDSTPTFIVLAAGKPPKVARGDRVFEVLQSEEYKNIGRSEEGKK
jgi:protein-disulfide isomerase